MWKFVGKHPWISSLLILPMVVAGTVATVAAIKGQPVNPPTP